MIEPSAEAPLNVNALSLFSNSPMIFDRHAQQSLRGGWFEGIYFHPCSRSIHEPIVNIEPLARRKRKLSMSDDENEIDDFQVTSRVRRRSEMEETEENSSDNDAMDQEGLDYPGCASNNSRVNSNGSIFLREEIDMTVPGPQYHISRLSLRGSDDHIAAVNDENALLRSPIVSSPQWKYRKINSTPIAKIGSPMILSSQQSAAMMVEESL